MPGRKSEAELYQQRQYRLGRLYFNAARLDFLLPELQELGRSAQELQLPSAGDVAAALASLQAMRGEVSRALTTPEVPSSRT